MRHPVGPALESGWLNLFAGKAYPKDGILPLESDDANIRDLKIAPFADVARTTIVLDHSFILVNNHTSRLKRIDEIHRDIPPQQTIKLDWFVRSFSILQDLGYDKDQPIYRHFQRRQIWVDDLLTAEGRHGGHHGAHAIVIPHCGTWIDKKYADVLDRSHWWFDVGRLTSDNDPVNRGLDHDEYYLVDLSIKVDITDVRITEGEYAHSGKAPGPRIKECKISAIMTMQFDLRDTKAARGSGEESR